VTAPKPLASVSEAGRHAITPLFGVVMEFWNQRMHLVAPFVFRDTIATSGAYIVAMAHVLICARCALAALAASCPSARGGY
jgi:uncharacterized paraquat-inducible protein A